jgi:hypothetical protein
MMMILMKNLLILLQMANTIFKLLTQLVLLAILISGVACKVKEPAKTTAKEYREPLSDDEIRAMTSDAPHLLRIIKDNHLVVANGSIAFKSVMDAVGPTFLEILKRIDGAQAQLPKDSKLVVNTTLKQTTFMNTWKESNSTYDAVKSAVGIKRVIDSFSQQDFGEQLRKLNKTEQIGMRVLFTHTRDKIMQVKDAPMIKKYKENSENAIGGIYEMVSQLMSALKEIRFQVLFYRVSGAAKVREQVLWDLAEQEHDRRNQTSRMTVQTPIGEYRA